MRKIIFICFLLVISGNAFCMQGMLKQDELFCLLFTTQNLTLTPEQIACIDPKTVNTFDQSGWTPLHVAAYRGFIDAAKALIAKGAKVNAVEKKLGYTPLCVAAQEGKTGMVSLLIQNKANVDAKNKSGATPLHKAAMQGHTETVAALIQGGANVNAVFNSYTPLHCALDRKHLNVAAELIKSHKINLIPIPDQAMRFS